MRPGTELSQFLRIFLPTITFLMLILVMFEENKNGIFPR